MNSITRFFGAGRRRIVTIGAVAVTGGAVVLAGVLGVTAANATPPTPAAPAVASLASVSSPAPTATGTATTAQSLKKLHAALEAIRKLPRAQRHAALDALRSQVLAGDYGTRLQKVLTRIDKLPRAMVNELRMLEHGTAHTRAHLSATPSATPAPSGS